MKQALQIIGFDYSGDLQETKPFILIILLNKSIMNTSFYKATPAEVNLAVAKASAAFQVYRQKSGVEKANFLNNNCRRAIEHW